MATCGVLATVGLSDLVGSRGAAPASSPPELPDRVAEGLAERFARAYMSWDPEAPDERERRLRELGALPDVAAGDVPKKRAVVGWSNVVASQRRSARTVATVAIDTSVGLTYLAVTVTRDRRGRLLIDRPPAIVGAPAVSTGGVAPLETEVEDPGLRALGTRVVRNYLSLDREDLAADVAAGVPITFPAQPFRIADVGPATWQTKGRRVAVAVTVEMPGGLELPLRYELSVVRQGGRWLVRSIHVNPTHKEEDR